MLQYNDNNCVLFEDLPSLITLDRDICWIVPSYLLSDAVEQDMEFNWKVDLFKEEQLISCGWCCLELFLYWYIKTPLSSSLSLGLHLLSTLSVVIEMLIPWKEGSVVRSYVVSPLCWLTVPLMASFSSSWMPLSFKKLTWLILFFIHSVL